MRCQLNNPTRKDMIMKVTTRTRIISCNDGELIAESNRTFVSGTRFGNRRVIARRLAQIINFPGGYRAAYRAVKNGYRACDMYAGPIDGTGRYGLNCWAH